MAVILPFKGLLPPVEKVTEVAAVPYDVVNTEEAAQLAAGKPLSFLRVSRPEIEMDPGIDLHDDRVYAKAAENFRRLREVAPLLTDDEARLYIYSLTMGDHVQTGVLGASSAREYENDLIKKHEKTRKDKEDDRTRHVMTLRSHTGPVFLTYRDVTGINAKIDAIRDREVPLYDFTAEDGIRHQLWRASVEGSRDLSALFNNDVPCLYIADGHHRAAAAARSAVESRKNNPNHTGEEDYNFFLTVTFPAKQLRILPYNRAVKDLNGLNLDAFLAKVSEKFTIEDTSEAAPSQPGVIHMYLDGTWRRLTPLSDAEERGVIDRLDVSVLQNDLLEPALGIEDPRTSSRIDFVGGIRGTGELERLVDGGKASVAFSMYPTTVDQLMDIADAGEIMPPKSTWFEPKLRDGLVCHDF